MIEKYGEIRFLINYSNFIGWEQGAAKEDMFTYALFRKKLKKFALVNPPEIEIFRQKIVDSNLSGETKFFSEDQPQDVLDWVKS